MVERQSVAEVLARAADLLEKPGAWTQSTAARDVEGKPVEPTDPSACKWCAVGAINLVGGNEGDTYDRACAIAGGDQALIEFNDRFGRTQAEVVLALRAAGALAVREPT